MRHSPPLFGTFGWTVAGALALGLSFPPVSFYPLAWVALVPWIVRWRLATSKLDYAREIYAAVLVWSCSAGFWLLFHPDPTQALLGGFGLLVAPVPLAAAFVAALAVRHRFGLAAGLAALVVNVQASEYVLLHLPGGVPWLLLGHTQSAATPFVQTADLGGVPLVSAWVLLLNVVASLAVARATQQQNTAASVVGTRGGERGFAVGLLALLIMIPVLYGAAQSARMQSPVGYARLGLVQPGTSPEAWMKQSPAERIDALAQLSSLLLVRWRGGEVAPTPADTVLVVDDFVASASTDRTLGMLVWPHASLPDLGSDDRDRRLLDRLAAWCDREGVDLLAGGTLPHPAPAHAPSAADGEAPERARASAALLIRAGRPPLRYDQMRRLPLADDRAPRGDERIVFPSGGARLAATLGFESMFGDHVRQFAAEGADALVVLSQPDWWGRAGAAQHLAFTRFRAIEMRRTVVVSTVGGGSSLVTPTGEVETLAGWTQPALIPLDVPLYRDRTVYASRGDWIGLLAFWLALLGNVAVFAVSRMRPLLPSEVRTARVARPVA